MSRNHTPRISRSDESFVTVEKTLAEIGAVGVSFVRKRFLTETQ
jgi:hypothetical protein